MHIWVFFSLVAGIVAQELSGLPPCAQECISNLLAKGPALGCPNVNGQPNAICLCKNGDFGYGLQDCSTQACPAGTDISAIIGYGLAYCDAAAVISKENSLKSSSTSAAETSEPFLTLTSLSGSMSTTASDSGSTSTTASAVSSEGSSAAGNTTTTTRAQGLSSVAKIGIGLGLGLGAVLLLLIGAATIITRRRKKGQSKVPFRNVSQTRYDKPELDGANLPKTHSRAELEGEGPMSELEGSSGPSTKVGDDGVRDASKRSTPSEETRFHSHSPTSLAEKDVEKY